MADRHDEDMKLLMAAYKTAGHMEAVRREFSPKMTAYYELLKLWASERSTQMTEPEYLAGEADYLNQFDQFVSAEADALNSHTALLYYQFVKE